MTRLTGLFQRGGSYYLRIVLPQQHPLKALYRNGCLVQTLGPCSHREAVIKGTVKRAEVLGGYQSAIVQPAIAPPLTTAVPVKRITLRDVYERWQHSKERSEDSRRACQRAMNLFTQHLGNIELMQLTRNQGDSFRARLIKQAITSKTARAGSITVA